MSYPVLLTLHLFAALMFVGTVFFENIILEGARKHVERGAMHAVERVISQRARRVMPWVLVVLYGAGFAMGWRYRDVLLDPFASAFGLLLSLKILMAMSVLVHFIRAITWMASGRMTPRRSRF